MAPDETVIFARLAADKLGATTMDRPEWVAANPFKAEAYVCLTNNKNRGKEGKKQPLTAVNPRVNNQYGQIVRWEPAGVITATLTSYGTSLLLLEILMFTVMLMLAVTTLIATICLTHQMV